jgi:hypothetical protein
MTWRIKSIQTGNYYSGFDWVQRRSSATWTSLSAARRVLQWLKRDWPGDRWIKIMRAK